MYSGPLMTFVFVHGFYELRMFFCLLLSNDNNNKLTFVWRILEESHNVHHSCSRNCPSDLEIQLNRESCHSRFTGTKLLQ